jgi:hypothetical protein
MTPSPPTSHHFQTSQPRELLACLEFSAEQAEKVIEDKGAWRWLAIAMTLGVQNACLCALDAHDELGAKSMTRTAALEVRRWTRAGRRGPPPRAVVEPRIVSPLELLRRVGDPFFLHPPFQLPLTHEITRAFDDLVDLRNTFLHFSEDGWIIDLMEIPPLILNACGMVRHLAVVQPAYLSRAERGHRDRARAALERVEVAMAHYAASSANLPDPP